MGEQLLIENGAPTLANLKTASLFTVSAKTPEEARRLLEDWLPVLARKGVSLEILRNRGNSLLVYLYREGRLQRDLCQCLARERLCREGYRCENPRQALETLKKRLSESGEFPHEIGLFLGYPPEDVEGFIENRGKNCKCVGCWKVYGDPEQAVRQFARFKKCREVYLRLYQDGKKSLDQLTVAS